jgi:hypothetical protein
MHVFLLGHNAQAEQIFFIKIKGISAGSKASYRSTVTIVNNSIFFYW